MTLEQTMEDISGINFVAHAVKAQMAIEKLVKKFPKNQQLNYKPLIELTGKETAILAVINLSITKTQQEQANNMDAIETARGSFAAVEALLKADSGNTSNFIKHTYWPFHNYATLKDIDNVHKLLLEAISALDKIYEFVKNNFNDIIYIASCSQ